MGLRSGDRRLEVGTIRPITALHTRVSLSTPGEGRRRYLSLHIVAGRQKRKFVGRIVYRIMS